ncbi:energy transducer TonB [Sphingomonas panacisoli]|nr:energy transducer TonB [Sphingomonas panacisoli]
MDPGDNCFAVDQFTGGWQFAVSITAERKQLVIIAGPLRYEINDKPDLIWTIGTEKFSRGVSIVTAVDGGGKRVIAPMQTDFLSKMEVAPSIEVNDAGGKVVGFNLNGLKPAIDELRKCGRELIRLDTGSGLPAITKAQPRNLASLITPDDYPPAALRANLMGRTVVALKISAHGLVSDCAVTGSSGSADLDDATCRVMRVRARFTPAKDGSGRPTRDSYNTNILWQIPHD